jgi:AraC family transcriptional regulator
VKAWVERWEDEGVAVTRAELGDVRVQELRFPPGYAQAPFDPDRGYFAVVLDGGLEKSFPRRTVGLPSGSVATIPEGAFHSASFGRLGARVLVVHPPREPGAYGPFLRGVRARAEPGLAALGGRIVAELAAPDAAAPIAAEGLALELMAAALRAEPLHASSVRPPWLSSVLEHLHGPEVNGGVNLTELAGVVNVHPAHLARVFRRHYGVSVGTYLRRVRLDRAAARLARSDDAVARIAADEGFADQSHFTRAFKCHTGVTPARYRRLTRS